MRKKTNKTVAVLGVAVQPVVSRRFDVCRMNGRVMLVSITPEGRTGDTIAEVLDGFEGNLDAAMTAAEAGNLVEAKRTFENKP